MDRFLNSTPLEMSQVSVAVSEMMKDSSTCSATEHLLAYSYSRDYP